MEKSKKEIEFKENIEIKKEEVDVKLLELIKEYESALKFHFPTLLSKLEEYKNNGYDIMWSGSNIKEISKIAKEFTDDHPFGIVLIATPGFDPKNLPNTPHYHLISLIPDFNISYEER